MGAAGLHPPRRLRTGKVSLKNARELVGQRLERQLLADVQDETLARVLDGLDRRAQPLAVAAGGVLAQGVEAIAVVDDGLGALDDAADVAQPQRGELQAVVQRAGRRAARRALRALVALALDALALPRRGHLELGRHAPVRLGDRLLARAPGLGEQLAPRALPEVVA